jgi:hypothetical protein
VPLALNNRRIVTNLAVDATPTNVDGSVADLLQITIMGTNANGVQLIGNGLGSPGSGKCSRSGGPVLDNQEMVLAVGTFLPRMGFTNAHLNVESKFGATLEYALSGSGFTGVANLPKSDDNGPDFSDGGNKAVDIVGPCVLAVDRLGGVGSPRDQEDLDLQREIQYPKEAPLDGHADPVLVTYCEDYEKNENDLFTDVLVHGVGSSAIQSRAMRRT